MSDTLLSEQELNANDKAGQYLDYLMDREQELYMQEQGGDNGNTRVN